MVVCVCVCVCVEDLLIGDMVGPICGDDVIVVQIGCTYVSSVAGEGRYVLFQPL